MNKIELKIQIKRFIEQHGRLEFFRLLAEAEADLEAAYHVEQEELFEQEELLEFFHNNYEKNKNKNY